MIVCIEGVDACGKTTQAKRLAAELNCPLLSFPDYPSPTGKLIREHLLGGIRVSKTPTWRLEYMDSHCNAMVLQTLMLTNRMEHAPVIREHLRTGADLVLARYWPSGVAYGEADGLDREWLYRIHEALPQAHTYVLLDLDAEESVCRRPDRQDRYEADLMMMHRVVRNYRNMWQRMAETHDSRWAVLDGRLSEDEVYNEIKKSALL
jgi:thymidylate kinase